MALKLKDPVCTMILQSRRAYDVILYVRRGLAVGLCLFNLQSLGSGDHESKGTQRKQQDNACVAACARTIP